MLLLTTKYHYNIINNVVGYFEEDSEYATGWSAVEEETTILLKETEKSVKNGRKGTICGSGNVRYLIPLNKKT
jgi:hypothetical protein